MQHSFAHAPARLLPSISPSYPVRKRRMTTACLFLVLQLGTASGSFLACKAATSQAQGGSCADGDGSGCGWACRFIFEDGESRNECTASCNSRWENGLYHSSERVGCRDTCAAWGNPPSPPSPPPLPPLLVSGGCHNGLGSTTALSFVVQGTTASGAPYYRALHSGSAYWLYWDPDCNGGLGQVARWIVSTDTDAPSTTAPNDLDGDGNCIYSGRIDSDDSSSPPQGLTRGAHGATTPGQTRA